MDETELKPCPFCGETHEWETRTDFHWGKGEFIICRHRALLSAYSPHEKKYAEHIWQSRPIEDALRAEVARLTAELAAANEAQRWIPVGERLPEVGVRVDILRTCPDGYDYQNGCLTADGYWWSEILACKLKHVTHWMPLPPAMEARNE